MYHSANHYSGSLEEGGVICSNCNTWVADETAFCPYCGNKLQSIPTGQTQRQVPSQQQAREELTLPSEISGTIIFRPDEKPIRAWSTAYMDKAPEGILQFPARDGARASGYLIATTERLIFLDKKGLFSTRYTILESIDYEQIRGLTAAGHVVKYLKLSLEGSEGVRTPMVYNTRDLDMTTFESIGKTDYNDLRQSLNMLISRGLAAKKEEKRKERIQYVLDFSFLKMQMEKGGVVVQNIKCPNCGASVVLPSGGSSMNCQYCGSMIYAQDVFDKMKGLIGGL
jgi:DNA-directed RNA polymerase subunit RPC12/RpoP